MRYKKLFAVTFFLLLLGFQQIRVDAQERLKENSAQQNSLLPTLYVRIYHLRRNGSVAPGRIQCKSGDHAFGCVELSSSQYYPYDFNPMQLAYDADPNNRLQIDIETDYLLDVLSHEMDVPNYPNLLPLQSLAVAARSFADYNFRAQGGMINNSTEDLVFVPYAFDSYLQNDEQRAIVRNAVTSTAKSYLALAGSPINAEFASDSVGFTVSSANPREPYLHGVKDPISTACDSQDLGQDSTHKVRGMSQRGANRWVFGNECSQGDGNPWPVRWDDYRQILVHYYTGIDILDESGAPIAPDNRWNLLWHDNFGFPTGEIPTLNHAQTYPLKLQLQNRLRLGASLLTKPGGGVVYCETQKGERPAIRQVQIERSVP